VAKYRKEATVITYFESAFKIAPYDTKNSPHVTFAMD